ncbi:MAG: hypothetical protein DI547_04900 [Sphingobium sp.]|nr:MAG: hypothetical protein DI547_04900 [Sphingobium sp.]
MAKADDKAPDWRRAEQERVDGILRRDADDRREERRRAEAEIEVARGVFVNLDDTVVPPTPELLSKGDFVSYTPKGKDGTVRSVRTVRRRIVSMMVTLHSRGVLDDDQLQACKWYRDRYEAAQMEPRFGVSSYGESVRGDPLYGHMPRSQWAAEARSDFRWAQSFIPEDVRDTFELIVLQDRPMREAARDGRCRYANIAAAFRRGALALHGGIANRLTIDPAKRSSDRR